jgi:hypothetical protein
MSGDGLSVQLPAAKMRYIDVGKNNGLVLTPSPAARGSRRRAAGESSMVSNLTCSIQ